MGRVSLITFCAVLAVASVVAGASGRSLSGENHAGQLARVVDGLGRPAVLVYAKAVAGSPSAPEWIWRAQANGSHAVRLLRGSAPVVSPDGRTIAFTRSRLVTSGGATSTVATLWLVRSDGSHARRITSTAGAFWPLVWSPDSRRLIAGGSDRLYLVVRSTNAIRPLPGTETGRTFAIQQVSFAPEARSIVYDRFDQTGADLYELSFDGGLPAQLSHDHKSFAPLWGPSKIAYQRGFLRGDIWLMSGEGQTNTRLTRTAAGYYPAAWSRDGRRLLGANPAMHNGRLWAVQVATGRARPLTRWVGDLFAQGLSRNGQVVYAAVGCGGVTSALGWLETIPFKGGRPTVIVHGPCRGSWSS
jgi:dipeptidyl aminopeptidase/acylaminoacyl peptidase